jgi:hypothetical protein
MSHADTFWKLFWIVVGVLASLFFAVVLALVYFYNPTKTADAAAVGIVFDPSRDPFANKRPDDNRPKFTGEYFYQDALPLAFADWSWGVSVNWNSSEEAYDGTDSFKVNFLQDWSGVRVQASPIDLSLYKGISLAIYPKGQLDDLYIELFDASGNTLGRQSLAWYTSSGKFSSGAWNRVEIPFKNLFPEGQSPRAITGFAISTVHPGVAFIDAVHLEGSVPSHDRWYEPKPVDDVPEKPDPPIPLSYALNSGPIVKNEWKTIFGKFEPTPDGVRIGTTPEKTTGSMSFIRGGQNWSDYSVDTTTYWGQTSSFSILVRYKDDANFVSCAFSNYDAVAQLYEVKKGVSTLIGASPGLAIREYEPWKDAKAGASVQGDRVSCFVDGEQVLSYEIPDITPTGSAGLETWTQNTYDSPHLLQEYLGQASVKKA